VVKKIADTTNKRRPPKRVFVALALALAVLIIGLTVWVLAAPARQKAVVGNWTNAQGGAISFYPDGTGFVPGVEGVISDTHFTYSFSDSRHVKINISGTDLNVGIKIEGDTMTWSNGYNDTQDVYTRTR
jgi:hypothetical protein